MAAQLVLEGNRLVLDDIGRQTARFWSRFHDQRQIADAELEAFLGGMDPRPAEDGGQALLQRAFREYARAANASDPAEKHQAAYFANCLAILNEHVKLQPYIEGSMPFIVRRCVTERMLSFDIGSLTLAVSSDVPPLDGRDFPDTLVELTDASLLDFLNGPKGYDRAKDELVDSAAGDWTSLEDRMAYIVNLFRCFHLDPSVLEPPYEPAAERDIVRGRIPVGAL